MFNQLGVGSDRMALSLMLWLCSLPLLALLIPLLGLRVVGLATLLWLLVVATVCWGICGWRTFTAKGGHRP